MAKSRLPTDEERALWRETTKHDERFHSQEDTLLLPQTWDDADLHSSLSSPRRRGSSLRLGFALDPRLRGDDMQKMLTPQPLPRRSARAIAPEATLDLHGMTAEEALVTLRRVLPRWVREGVRCACIITGKGRGGEGRLRRELPHWLELPVLRPYIRGLHEAPARLGGTGAWVVMLRRS